MHEHSLEKINRNEVDLTSIMSTMTCIWKNVHCEPWPRKFIDNELIFFYFGGLLHKGRMKEAKLSKSYFKANEAWETAVSLLLIFYLLPCMAFSLHSFLPLQVYGVGSVMAYIMENHGVAVRNTFFILMVAHLTEAVIASIIATYMDMEMKTVSQWFFSVFIHGFWSFRHLLHRLYEYEERREAGSGMKPQIKLGLTDFVQ